MEPRVNPVLSDPPSASACRGFSATSATPTSIRLDPSHHMPEPNT